MGLLKENSCPELRSSSIVERNGFEKEVFKKGMLSKPGAGVMSKLVYSQRTFVLRKSDDTSCYILEYFLKGDTQQKRGEIRFSRRTNVKFRESGNNEIELFSDDARVGVARRGSWVPQNTKTREKTFVLRAESKEDADDWLEKIEQAIKRSNERHT